MIKGQGSGLGNVNSIYTTHITLAVHNPNSSPNPNLTLFPASIHDPVPIRNHVSIQCPGTFPTRFHCMATHGCVCLAIGNLQTSKGRSRENEDMHTLHLCNVSTRLTSILFADDTSCFIEGTDLADMCVQLSSEMNKLSTWFKTNRLSLSMYQKQIA